VRLRKEVKERIIREPIMRFNRQRREAEDGYRRASSGHHYTRRECILVLFEKVKLHCENRENFQRGCN
jgi:hypothetical protein